MEESKEFQNWCQQHGVRWKGDDGSGRYVCQTHRQLGNLPHESPARIVLTPRRDRIAMWPENVVGQDGARNEIGWASGDGEMTFTVNQKEWTYEDIDFSDEEIKVEQPDIRISPEK